MLKYVRGGGVSESRSLALPGLPGLPITICFKVEKERRKNARQSVQKRQIWEKCLSQMEQVLKKRECLDILNCSQYVATILHASQQE